MCIRDRYCRGKGLTPSVETLGLSFLRKLSLEVLKESVTKLRGVVPVDVAEHLLNKKRKELLDLETRHDLSIVIEGNISMAPGDCNILNES